MRGPHRLTRDVVTTRHGFEQGAPSPRTGILRDLAPGGAPRSNRSNFLAESNSPHGSEATPGGGRSERSPEAGRPQARIPKVRITQTGFPKAHLPATGNS